MSRATRAVGVLLLCFSWVAGVGAAEPLVTDVQVRGLYRVEAELVLQKLKTKAGLPYDAQGVRDDLSAIYALGYFRDVKVDLDDGGRVTFLVVERPAVNEWRVEGSKEVEKDDLAKAVTVKRRDILDAGRADDGARALRDLFRDKGFYLAEVKWEAVALADGKNQVDLVYRVKEGQKVQVKELHLMGASPSADKEVRGYLASSEVGFWSWLGSGGTFKESDLERDREMIRSYYLNHGYVEVKVLDPRVSLTLDRMWLKIDLPVQEGEKFQVGAVSVSGDLEFPLERLQEAAGMKQGDLFRSDDLRRGMQQISDLYADIGYAFSEVEPGTKLDKAARTVAVDFLVRKGDRVRLGRVEVRGNTKTRDRIVRREMRLSEGELYSATALRRSREKIEALGFFDKVNVTTNRRPGTDLVDVDIEVLEKATGSFTIGAGYSSTDKLVGMASVSQRNLLGLGYQLALSANLGTGASRKTYSLTFNNPRVFDSTVYAGFDVFNQTHSYTDYTKDSTGGDVKLGTALGEDWRVRGIYRYENAKVHDVSDSASSSLKLAEGKTVTSSFSTILTYDTRDNPWEPHRGAQGDLSAEYAGPFLGGTAAYLKFDLEGAKYFGLWWGHVLTLHAQGGYIRELEDGGIPIFTRYSLGGLSSVRGFASGSIGPKDENGDVLGGNKMAQFNAEYIFPLIDEAKLKGVVFFDAGNAWGDGEGYFSTVLRTGAGVGIRWFSPMGPLRLEYGWNLRPEKGEDRSKWEFSIGGFF